MEADIAFTDWMDSMDMAGSNHWLPAYGYQQPMQDGETTDGAGVLVGTQQPPFIFLETIVEETSDDLQSESDRSHAGWPDSDSDTESVIHVPHSLDARNGDAPEWSGSERDLAVPKKRRRRAAAADDEDDERADTNSLSSRSSSLLQFECLEKHCEDVFHTSATADPFEGATPRVDAEFSFESVEANHRWHFSDSPDSLDEHSNGSTSDDDDDASSDDTMLHSSWSSRGSFRSQNSRIRSYRSFDSLNILQHKQHLSLVELSQSLNNEDFVLTQYDAYDNSLVAATVDLSKLGADTVVTSQTTSSPTERSVEKEVAVAEEPTITTEAKSQRSAENLSEDSGFGDHIPKLSTMQGRLRNATILEDEDDSSSSYYSSSSSSSSSSGASGDSEDADDRVIASTKSLKLASPSEFAERRGWNEEESKFINSCWQSAPNLATLLFSCREQELQEEEEEEEEEGVEEEEEHLATRKEVTTVCSGQPTRVVTSRLVERNVPDVADVFVKRDDLIADVCDENRFNQFKMASRLPVVSTPNLNYNASSEFLQSEQTHHSMNRVPLKHFSVDDDELDKEVTSKSLTPFPTNAKGVHFCPVVSEVSWRESYSEEDPDDPGCEETEEDDDDETEDDDDEEDEDEEDEDDNEDVGVQIEELDDSTEVVQQVVATTHGPMEPDVVLLANTTSSTSTATETITHTALVPVPPTRQASHVVLASTAPNQRAAVVNQAVMDAHVSNQSSESLEVDNATTVNKKPSRFGGFFQRFSFRRRHDAKKDDTKKKTDTKKPKIAKKPQYGEYEDVTFIPLHPPPQSETRPDVVISAKPPLPPQPPRVVGASVKAPAPAPRRTLGILQTSQGQQHQRRPTTFTDVSVEGSSSSSSMSGVSPNRQVSHKQHTKSASIDPIHQRQQHPAGLLETDLDTDITISAQRPPLPPHHVAPKKARSLLNLGMNQGLSIHNGGTHNAGMQLKPPTGAGGATTACRVHGHGGSVDARAKSMEFLLDKENQAAVQPPENELQKGGAGGERVMSEHQLRVQRSLQKLNVPDWYKNSTVARGHEGFLLRKDAAAGGHGRETTHQGWPGLGSKTTSLSSLGSTQSAAARSPTSHLLSPSPTPSPHVFTRWSTSRLNSGGTSASTSPCNSTRSSFNYRQPYLGWRSQERLAHPRTPAERLAAGILPQQQQQQPQTPVQQQQVPNLTEVRTSIKEVTSAIVHYVSGVRDGSGTLPHNLEDSPANRSPRWERESMSPRDQWSNRSSSPRGSGRMCWLESSFVGSRPLEAPETPVALTQDKTNNLPGGGELYLDLNNTTKQQQQHHQHQQQQHFNTHRVNANALCSDKHLI